MKKTVFLGIFIFTLFSYAFGQQLTIAVSPFEIRNGFSQDEADIITDLFISELVRRGGGARIVDRNSFDRIMTEMRFQASDWADSNRVARLGAALNANSIITGQLMQMGNLYFITANLLDINTAQIISSSRLQLSSKDEIFNRITEFVNEIAQNFPRPNPLIGRWEGIVGRSNISDTVLDHNRSIPQIRCILNFRADGTIIVERFDTWELRVFYQGTRNRLNYTNYSPSIRNGSGSGRYSYNYTSDDRINISINLTLSGIHSGFSSSVETSGTLVLNEEIIRNIWIYSVGYYEYWNNNLTFGGSSYGHYRTLSKLN